MTQKEYEKNNEQFFRNKKVRLVKEISNGKGNIFGVGTVMTIKRKYKGFELEQISICKECNCGERRSIHGVNPQAIELVM